MKKILFAIAAVSILAMACLPPKTIYAKSLCDADYNPDEWHFVITQVKDKASAPSSIQVKFLTSGGSIVWKTVPLWKYTGKTAHYLWTGNLQAKVLQAKAVIYPAWSGQFNLSHGPMNCGKVTYTLEVDCEGWSVAFFKDGQPAGGESGLWKDLTTDESFTLTQIIDGKRYPVFIQEPQDCYKTCDRMTDWVFISTTEEQKPNGTIVIKHVYLKYDALDKETVCDQMVAVERIPYKQCTEVVVGEWTPWSGDGKDKTSYREYRDVFTGELCNTEYREKCESQNFVHFWTDGFCKFRDRTYPLNASWMVNPPVFMQNAYCGCGYEPHGPWGIVEVGECDEDGYKYWTELPPYCGYQSCE